MSCCCKSRDPSRAVATIARFAGWVEPGLHPGEAQQFAAHPLGFTRTTSGFNPTYGLLFPESRSPREAIS